MLIGLLVKDPVSFIIVVAVLIVSLSIHEFSHAIAADKLGDNTARLLGRVTLNPLAHLDPLGSMFILLAGFGWGKPVPFNPINLRNPKRDSAIIAFAGPLSNFIIAFLLSLLFKLFGMGSFLGEIFILLIVYNVVLGSFNLLPLHPLDGFKVVGGLLPTNLYIQWMQMQPYGIVILMLLVMTRSTSVVIEPFISFIISLLRL